MLGQTRTQRVFERISTFSTNFLQSNFMLVCSILMCILCAALVVWIVVWLAIHPTGTAEIVFIVVDSLIILWFIFEVILQIFHFKKKFFTHILNIIDVIIIIISIIGFSLQIFLFLNPKDDPTAIDVYEIVVLTVQVLQTLIRFVSLIRKPYKEYRRRRTIKKMPFRLPQMKREKKYRLEGENDDILASVNHIFGANFRDSDMNLTRSKAGLANSGFNLGISHSNARLPSIKFKDQLIIISIRS
ncbi:MAG: hypothetical protein EZS28_022487 [Streblomastix strix]|uniref:Ion transport domain-containing protein n=1 Tax=Streblomastix strix TaxID=222440 RepID=A0A5J4VHB6_9EUKA|nr:MAG: hypothetical protein EZS28_022487 [Streblomastix strix]